MKNVGQGSQKCGWDSNWVSSWIHMWSVTAGGADFCHQRFYHKVLRYLDFPFTLFFIFVLAF